MIAVGSAALFSLAAWLGLDVASPFTRNVQPLTADRWWLLAIWLVFWPVNILGEEFLWRAVLLPRMVTACGGWAWAPNAALWGVFHVGFGVGNNLVLLPTLLTVPWVVQRTRNAWLGVILHALLSLPGFVAIALGKV